MVVDKDNGTQDDLVDTITIPLGILQINSASAAGLTFSIQGNHNHGRIILTAKVYCAPFHYGGQCQFFMRVNGLISLAMEMDNAPTKNYYSFAIVILAILGLIVG